MYEKKKLNPGKSNLILAVLFCLSLGAFGLYAAFSPALNAQAQDAMKQEVQQQEALTQSAPAPKNDTTRPAGISGAQEPELAPENFILPALPQKVTFYQDGIKIETSQELIPAQTPDGNRVIVFALPPGTDLNTLRIDSATSSSPIELGSWNWESQRLNGLLRNSDLQKELQKTEAELLQVKALLQGINTRLALWGSTSGDWTLKTIIQPPEELNNANNDAMLRASMQFGSPALSSAEVEKLDNAIEARVPPLVVRAAALQDKAEKLSMKVSDLEARLAEKLDLGRTGFIISMQLIGKTNDPVKLNLSYYSDIGGWTPYYRLEALPEKNQIKLISQARLWQRSGQDWVNAEFMLSSQNGRQSIAPFPLNPWVIREREINPNPPKPTPRPMPMMAAATPAMDMKQRSVTGGGNMESADIQLYEAPMSPSVSVEQRSTFSLQNLGPMSLTAGARSTVPVKTEELKADFYRILRPANQSQSYLSAKLQWDDSLPQLASGEADFLVDGSFIGRGLFTLSPQAELFFGSDPLVNSEFRLEERRSGLQAASKNRIELWRWAITVRNGHNYPIQIKVEDTAPLVEPASYKVEIKSVPAPVREQNNFVWRDEIKSNDKLEIKHEVQITGPEKVLVYPGR